MDFAALYNLAEERCLPMGKLTIGDTIELAEAAHCKCSDVTLAEAVKQTGLPLQEVMDRVLAAFDHNLHATEVGVTFGHSFLMGTVAWEFSGKNAPVLIGDAFVNDILVNTLAAQVGNHEVGMQPCAGTGDSCPYTGFVKALMNRGESRAKIARVAAVILKVGSLFRVAKTTTGCNLEGLGAGAAALAAAFVELESGTPTQLGRAVTLALSPTIAVPCTPRVMVPGLCATHIGGGVLLARLAASLAMHAKTLKVTVPVDVMLALASAVHPLSAEHVVPKVIRYMEPFFKTHPGVECYIEPAISEEEKDRIAEVQQRALAEARDLAAKSRPIVNPFGLAVVGGSSQAVGSPTNAGRILFLLARKNALVGPQKVYIDLYPELFARRGINVPGILMAALYGSDTSDGAAYRVVMDKVRAEGITVAITKDTAKAQVQRVTVVYENGKMMVETLNRGGARLAIVSSSSGLEAAYTAAAELGIDVVD